MWVLKLKILKMIKKFFIIIASIFLLTSCGGSSIEPIDFKKKPVETKIEEKTVDDLYGSESEKNKNLWKDIENAMKEFWQWEESDLPVIEEKPVENTDTTFLDESITTTNIEELDIKKFKEQEASEKLKQKIEEVKRLLS